MLGDAHRPADDEATRTDDALERLHFDSLWLSERIGGPAPDPLVGMAFARFANAADESLIPAPQGLHADAGGAWGDVIGLIARLFRRKQYHKRRMRQLLRELRNSTAAIPDGVVMLNPAAEILWFNRSAAELLHLRSPGDAGLRIDSLVRRPEFVSYLRGADYRSAVVVPGGGVASEQHLHFQIVPYGAGQLLLMVRDVTREVRLEAMRKDFVANASHELRSPLTVMTGYLETLLADGEALREPQIVVDLGTSTNFDVVSAEGAYIGGAIGTLMAFLVAVKVGTTQDIIVMGVWTIVFNIVQGSFVAPVVYGKAVSLHPAIVLICIPAGMQLAGVMGMFLAVPILGIVAAVWRSLIAVMSDREHALAIEGGANGHGATADHDPPSTADGLSPGTSPA